MFGWQLDDCASIISFTRKCAAHQQWLQHTLHTVSSCGRDLRIRALEGARNYLNSRIQATASSQLNQLHQDSSRKHKSTKRKKEKVARPSKTQQLIGTVVTLAHQADSFHGSCFKNRISGKRSSREFWIGVPAGQAFQHEIPKQPALFPPNIVTASAGSLQAGQVRIYL